MNSGLDIKVKEFKGLTSDSRAVKSGYLFVALKGQRQDGTKFIGDAVRNGAAAVLAEEGAAWPVNFPEQQVRFMTVRDVRHCFALLAAEFYERQPQYIIAVTGTNGKTSVVDFVYQLWHAAGKKAASLGTLGLRSSKGIKSGSMTTPDPVALHASLADLAAVGVTHLAMEASSHGLDQYRLDGVRLKAAAFTNLSRDHLDYHGDMEHYYTSKRRLFSELLPNGATAVYNADCPECADLLAVSASKGHKILSYGFKGTDIRIRNIEREVNGQLLSLTVLGQDYDVRLPLVGEFQAMNAACALGLLLSESEQDAGDYVRALENLRGAPGRLQLVSGHPSGAAVYIDYAHTPDALENVLDALRMHTKGKLICIFGCGGDRDKGKRPLMGKIAHDKADKVYVTDDNPRSEEPAAIRKDVIAGLPDMVEIGGRREAIYEAVRSLSHGDVLLIAGKGHEQGQVFENHREDFDDFKVAQQAINEMRG